MTDTDRAGKLRSKRIQFHIDTATALPLPKFLRWAYVSVKITDIQDRLHTSACRGQSDPIWQQNLTTSMVSESSEVTFEVMQRSVWPRPSRLAMTDPYPLSTLLEMQGGNTFGTNIELPLHATSPDPGSPSPTSPAGSLRVNIRELSSRLTADLDVQMARRLSEELRTPVLETQNISAQQAVAEASPS
ncbi:hypothetical protein GGX14DRAFT_697382 [Mycena pura]|uniref:C2 domain-containing protein n=1 Tax=Mycena pura TaxID=153505 RepID=A0AAD6VJA3_9AGAR|nr:hypothetical protein GGX14DRAFT_697382 [Mycena pura]